MISFILLVLMFFIPVVYNFIIDIINNKSCIKWVFAMLLLVLAVYLKSIGY